MRQQNVLNQYISIHFKQTREIQVTHLETKSFILTGPPVLDDTSILFEAVWENEVRISMNGWIQIYMRVFEKQPKMQQNAYCQSKRNL